MAELPGAFKATDHEDMNDFSVIEEGEYIAQIVKSSMENCKETAKDPKGQYLKLQFKIIEGKHKGKMLWTQLNLVNKNATAVEIANKELGTICKAVGKVSINDSQELHGLPMKLKVGIKPAEANYPAKNIIKYYSKYDGSIPAEPVASESASTSDSDGGESEKKTPPWDQK